MVKPYHARQKQNKKTSGIMPLAKTNPGEIYCVSPPPAFAARQSAAPARRLLCRAWPPIFRRILSKPLFCWRFRKFVVEMRFNHLLVCSSHSIFPPNLPLGAPNKGK
jgi:hypothetical protein